MWAHKLYLACEYEQCKATQDTREKELRDKRSNANTGICFEIRAIALRPRLHTEGFQPSTQEPPLRNYNSTPKYTTPLSNTITSTQEGTKSKEETKLSDPMITNSLLVILKDHK